MIITIFFFYRATGKNKHSYLPAIRKTPVLHRAKHRLLKHVLGPVNLLETEFGTVGLFREHKERFQVFGVITTQIHNDNIDTFSLLANTDLR